MKHIVSFSGGKDSTAMLHWLLEKGYPVDGIIFMDTGWEFPAMLEHINLVEQKTGVEIVRVKPDKPFDYWMTKHPVVARKGPMKGEIHRIGYGWPSVFRRWCSRVKVGSIKRHMKKYKDATMYIGIAADETHRQKQQLKSNGYVIDYPLIDWGKTEADCLEYCKSLGYHWNGLYNIFNRVSCFCCPLQRIGSLRNLRKHFPDLWKQMLDWDDDHMKKFKGDKSVHDLERRFAQEDKQGIFPLFREG